MSQIPSSEMSAKAHPPLLILGGGQLSQMLVQSAKVMGLQSQVLSENADDPAIQAGAQHVRGSERDAEVLKRLFKQSCVVTFENEFVDTVPLEQAAQDTQTVFRPNLSCVRTLQDKIKQKALLQVSRVPTAPFSILDLNSPEEELARVGALYRAGVVLKWARLGYDGKGTWIGPTGRELNQIERDQAISYLAAARDRSIQVFAEEKIPFSCEVAMVAARGVEGQIVHYPLVVSEQAAGICRVVRGPAVGFGVSPVLAEEAQASMTKILVALDYVGVLACEFFVTANGNLLVNELAPRVHNSGHYTQDAASVSQFENHVRCVLGLPPQQPRFSSCFVMGNLIGPPGVRALASKPVVDKDENGLRLHWYGKSELRAGRKMGHVNAVTENAANAGAIERQVRAWIETWEASVLKERSQS